jgi:hypothetical protein
MSLGQVFFKYFGFPCQSLVHQLLHNHNHLSSRTGTIGQQYQVDTVSPQYQVDTVSPQYQVDTVSPQYQVDTVSPQ